MVLVMDIGNTNIKCGLYEGDTLVNSFRVATDQKRTGDEYGAVMRTLFHSFNYKFSDVEGIIMSSVAPSLNYTMEHVCKVYFGISPIVVAPGIKTGINIKYDNAKELGADRIVNSVSALVKYGAPSIVVDFGTATTFSVISRQGEFVGGAICPGIVTSMDALINKASKLSRFELTKPKNVVGKSTISNMQSGFIYGFIGLVKNIVDEIKAELNEPNAKVIATGGMSELMVDQRHKTIDVIDRELTLFGLKYIYDLNKEQK